MYKVFKDISENNHEEDTVDRNMIEQLDKKIHQTETLIQFQKEEASIIH